MENNHERGEFRVAMARNFNFENFITLSANQRPPGDGQAVASMFCRSHCRVWDCSRTIPKGRAVPGSPRLAKFDRELVKKCYKRSAGYAFVPYLVAQFPRPPWRGFAVPTSLYEINLDFRDRQF